MSENKKGSNIGEIMKMDDKEFIRKLLEGLVSEIDHVNGVLAVADDGVILDDVNVDDADRIGAIAVFMGTIGVYVGETLHLGTMENSLVEFQGQKLIIVHRDIYYLGILIDPKGSVKYIKTMVNDFLRSHS
ncbi:MAG: roadblock/LC7 domain-containing protein [Candidatus Cloacimonetes bacterium]|nr:roadblock/LC7 domain-containing protein [Candidatus Cloacimonadota bacterium]